MRTTACKSNGPGPGRREGEQPSVSPACWDHRARGWRPRHQKRVAHHLPVPTYTGPYAIVAAERMVAERPAIEAETSTRASEPGRSSHLLDNRLSTRHFSS